LFLHDKDCDISQLLLNGNSILCVAKRAGDKSTQMKFDVYGQLLQGFDKKRQNWRLFISAVTFSTGIFGFWWSCFTNHKTKIRITAAPLLSLYALQAIMTLFMKSRLNSR
jgi:hypothetical protein